MFGIAEHLTYRMR